MREFIFAPGIPGTKTVSLDEFFEYLKTVKGSGTEQEMYQAVAWVFRCVQIRSNAVSSLPWEIKRGESVVDWKIPLRDLLWKTEAALLLSGAAYWLKRPATGELKSLQWLNPNSTKAITSDEGISRFEQQVGGKTKKYDIKEIVYFRSWNPGDDLGPGIAPARVALEAAGLAKNANRWASSFFDNGAIPGVILEVEGRIDPAEQERLESTWDRFVAGVKKFRTVALGSGMKAHVVGSPVKDVAMPELMEQVRQQIAVAFGIPQTVLEDAANYATAKEHRKSLYVETVIPESVLIEDVLNEQLFSRLPRPLVFGFKPNELEIMQEEETERAQALLSFVQAGIPLETAVAILGIDVPEGMSITPTSIPGAMPRVPMLSMRDWRGDLKKWEIKSLRYLKEQGTAICEFESDAIPPMIAGDLQTRLVTATSPEEVKAAFAATFHDQVKEAWRGNIVGTAETWEALFEEAARKLFDEEKAELLRILEGATKAEPYEAFLREGVAYLLVNKGNWKRSFLPLFADLIGAQMENVLGAYGIAWDVQRPEVQEWIDNYTIRFAASIGDTSEEAIRGIIGQAQSEGWPVTKTRDEIMNLWDGFSKERADNIARTETMRSSNRGIRQAWREAGVSGTKWHTHLDGRQCSWCEAMHGKTIRMDETYANVGDELSDAEGKLMKITYENVETPPLHNRCRCLEVAITE